MTRLLDALIGVLPAGETCLEVGVGTGRIALPLVEEGVRVVGVDISAEMLRKLVAARLGGWPQVAIADATRLPFADATFGSAIASHVLHLIPRWRSAVAEMLRVVRPGGVLVASRGSHLTGGWRDRVSRRFFYEAGDPPWPPGLDRIEELDVEMSALGARVEPFPDLMSEQTSSIEEMISALEDGVWAACWSLDEATRRRAAAATRQWARSTFGDLGAGRVAPTGSVWRAYGLRD
jgi:ubiquinone/menaquinone biosynthesis C-methylase UbiE